MSIKYQLLSTNDKVQVEQEFWFSRCACYLMKGRVYMWLLTQTSDINSYLLFWNVQT